MAKLVERPRNWSLIIMDYLRELVGVMTKVLLSLVLSVSIAVNVPVAAAQEESPTPAPREEVTEEKIDAAAEELKKNQEDLAAKKQEIADLDKKIKELGNQRDTTKAQADIINHQLSLLTSRLKQAQLELQQTQLNLQVVTKDKATTETDIGKLRETVQAKRQNLRAVLRSLYEHEEQSLIRIFFTEGSLSDVLAARDAYEQIQNQHITLMQELKLQEETLEQKQQQLEEQQQDLGQLQELLADQRQNLAAQQDEQETFLQAKRAEQVKYDQRLAEARQARQEIERDVFTLKNTGVNIKLTEARDIARYAEKLTGVRAALLLGVLKVETNLGTNLGSGVYPDDMHPASREAFLRVTAKLGLDPKTAPISARPRSYQGWGGAMGPGQFMPDTWEGIEARVAELMRKEVPNPYELTDAFVATAIFLADRGATAQAGEYEAVNRYLAGPNWQRFTWYGDRVLAVAQEYEKEGL